MTIVERCLLNFVFIKNDHRLLSAIGDKASQNKPLGHCTNPDDNIVTILIMRITAIVYRKDKNTEIAANDKGIWDDVWSPNFGIPTGVFGWKALDCDHDEAIYAPFLLFLREHIVIHSMYTLSIRI